MAKKSRTPPPPRRPVQAPRARTGGDGGGRRRLLIPIAIAAAGVAGLVAVAAVFLIGAGDSGSDPGALREAGCTVQAFPAQGRQHVQAVPKNFKYNSFPPTSGPHHPQPAPFDVYDDPVEQFRLVHNLEHGGVVIQYGRQVPRRTVDALVAWYRKDPNGIVIAPLPALGRVIALAAWTADVDASGAVSENGQGILAKCTRFDENAFNAFMDEYALRGPERFPKDQLAPGN